MSTPFGTNPKLSDWIPSEQQIQTITAARELWDLVPEEEGDETNKSCINILNVYSTYTQISPTLRNWQTTHRSGFTTSSYTAIAMREGTDA